MRRACGANDIKNILHLALFRKLRFQMIDDIDMETVNGVDYVVDLCLVVDGLLTEVRAFYYPSQSPQ
jgi:hypothetical protein